MKVQTFYSRIVGRGRRSNPSYTEAQSDLRKAHDLIRAGETFSGTLL